MKKAAVIILVLFCSLSCFAQSEITKEEYAFYSRFLSKDQILGRKTVFPEIEDHVKRSLDKLPKDLVQDFFDKNKSVFWIEDKIEDIKFPDELDKSWNLFNKDKNEIHFVFVTYQDVSRVGFSRNGKYALVYHSYAPEGVAGGSGHICWLVRKKNDWKLKKMLLIWQY